MAIQKITSGIIQDGAVAAADIVSVANTAITGNIISSQIAPDQTLNGNVSVTGTLAATGVSTFAAGTALLPALIPTGDPNTGVLFPAADTVAVSTAGSERMRIDSSGNVGIGLTNPGTNKLYVTNNSVADDSLRVTNARATSGDKVALFRLQANTNNTSSRFLTCSGNDVTGNGDAFIIYGNGNAVNVNNSYGAISDIKLKENIVDATPKLANLMQVKVRNYNMIGDTTKQIGVVAQELETVFPSMIDVTSDKDAENNDLGTTTKSVKYSIFVPILIKAIQEQQALITQLQADVATLKALSALEIK
jgi:hypothetical protein